MPRGGSSQRWVFALKLLFRALILCPAATITAATWIPTQADLESALKSAEGTWGYSIADKIHIGMEPLNACRADADQSAITNVQTTTTTTTSGNAAPPVVSTFYTYIIR